jgi:hypothetical protein
MHDPMKETLLYGLSPVKWSEEVLHIKPDPWQAGILEGAHKRVILNAARQGGKSTVTAILALHTAVFRPPATIVIISPSLSQSSESLKKVKQLLAGMPDKPGITKDNESRLEFGNGSRIIALPGSSITSRGFSAVDLLIIDEASRVIDEIYYSVRPLVAVSNGRIVVLSTPFGKRGFFYITWIDGGDGWERVLITADQCPRISPAFLEEERKALGERYYQQEYFCSFVDVEDAVFSFTGIMEAFTAEVIPLELGGLL